MARQLADTNWFFFCLTAQLCFNALVMPHWQRDDQLKKRKAGLSNARRSFKAIDNRYANILYLEIFFSKTSF